MFRPWICAEIILHRGHHGPTLGHSLVNRMWVWLAQPSQLKDRERVKSRGFHRRYIYFANHIVSTLGVKKRKCTGRCHLMQSLSSQVKSLMQNAVKVNWFSTNFFLILQDFYKKKTQVKMLQYELIFRYSKLMQIFKPCIKYTVLVALLINAYKNVENYFSIRWKTELRADNKKNIIFKVFSIKTPGV